MFDLTKCAEAEKYCKDCKNCMRHIMPDDKFQAYAPLHENKKTDKDDCEFYLNSIKIEPIIKDTTHIEDKYKSYKIAGQVITMRK